MVNVYLSVFEYTDSSAMEPTEFKIWKFFFLFTICIYLSMFYVIDSLFHFPLIVWMHYRDRPGALFCSVARCRSELPFSSSLGHTALSLCGLLAFLY